MVSSRFDKINNERNKVNNLIKQLKNTNNKQLNSKEKHFNSYHTEFDEPHNSNTSVSLIQNKIFANREIYDKEVLNISTYLENARDFKLSHGILNRIFGSKCKYNFLANKNNQRRNALNNEKTLIFSNLCLLVNIIKHLERYVNYLNTCIENIKINNMYVLDNFAFNDIVDDFIIYTEDHHKSILIKDLDAHALMRSNSKYFNVSHYKIYYAKNKSGEQIMNIMHNLRCNEHELDKNNIDILLRYYEFDYYLNKETINLYNKKIQYSSSVNK